MEGGSDFVYITPRSRLVEGVILLGALYYDGCSSLWREGGVAEKRRKGAQVEGRSGCV